MRIGPKYKIARRLGAPIFEKTQTEKYAASLARKEKAGRLRRARPKSEFGLELLEKQKARFTYGVAEKQFRSYAKNALKAPEPTQKLFRVLESRLDNVLFRAGFARTRFEGRQMASHGHIKVNGRRVTVPSIILKEGDRIGLREESTGSFFEAVPLRMKTLAVAQWLKVNPDKREAEVVGVPSYVPNEHVFDLQVVLEFYNR